MGTGLLKPQVTLQRKKVQLGKQENSLRMDQARDLLRRVMNIRFGGIQIIKMTLSLLTLQSLRTLVEEEEEFPLKEEVLTKIEDQHGKVKMLAWDLWFEHHECDCTRGPLGQDQVPCDDCLQPKCHYCGAALELYSEHMHYSLHLRSLQVDGSKSRVSQCRKGCVDYEYDVCV